MQRVFNPSTPRVMGPPLLIIATLLLACTLVSCGGITGFVAISSHPATFLTTSGTVSIVQLTVVDGQTQVTTVTLINNGTALTTNFCGNVVDTFPMDGFVTVNFTPASNCNNIVTIIN